MFPSPNLIDGIKLWIAMFLFGPEDLDYLDGDYGDNLKTSKTTLYLPLLAPSDRGYNTTLKSYQISQHLRSLNIVNFVTLQAGHVNDLSSTMIFKWSHKCGKRNELSLPIGWNGKAFVPAFDHRILGMTIFRSRITSVPKYWMIHFSFSTPVTVELLGEHSFSLTNANGDVIRKSPILLLKTTVNV